MIPKIDTFNKEYYDFISHHFNMFFSFEQFKKKKEYFIIYIKDGDELIGITLVKFHEFIGAKSKKNIKRYKIIYTIVKEEYRGKGLNQKLLDFTYEYAKQNGINYIVANIRKPNEQSINSFIKNGYKISNLKSKPYKNGDEKIRVIKFVK